MDIGKLAGAIIASTGVLALVGNAAIDYYQVKDRGIRTEGRVNSHDTLLDKITENVELLTDADLVGKAKQKSKVALCKRLVREGKLTPEELPSDCQEEEHE
jgi:hypothetical protein